jgi:branched-chain amino acid transport system ATP-binding protein
MVVPNPFERGEAAMSPKLRRAAAAGQGDAEITRHGEPVITTEELAAGHGGVAVLQGINIELRRGEVVALLGRNGAGKTTLLHTIAGLVPPLSGRLWINGAKPPAAFHARVRNGLGLVTEERAVIRRLTVLDNLRLGRGPVEAALNRFPELRPLGNRRAGLLSGGEQQMLALAKLLAAEPSALLIDELSLGLAPLIVERLLGEVRQAAVAGGAGVLLVEQQPTTALRVADRAYVIAGGRIRLSGAADDLLARQDEIEALYLAS